MFRSNVNAFQIGLVAGMRAMSAPALVSHKLSHTLLNPMPGSKLHFLTSPVAANILKVLAGGELIGDKAPSAPDRIVTPQLFARLAAGATSGAALNASSGEPVAAGAIAGGLGALVGSFAFFHLRRWLTEEKGMPDTVVALVEDGLALGLGWQAVQSTRVV
ncbi:DUF4126 family protein [Arsenicibacter rosenii]|uniref:DUF4126 domain-containing protein n=1 Tax=Arsenicibacter rosenii TaxID=1750698 RepID=A0A1S2VQ91_9BACT|nr:DUF4126 family protein [Arsenicibacter rosenii]OIN60939.1 DUF4126 domain-containing protein [Arsenicibacter rosenii]